MRRPGDLKFSRRDLLIAGAVSALQAHSIEGVDPTISPVEAKGVGELGSTGVAPAIANAIYNATGVRVRDHPITLDKLLDGMPDAV